MTDTNDTELTAAQAAEILGLQAAIGTVRAFVGCVDRNVKDISPEQHTREIAAPFKRLAAERDALRVAVRNYRGIVTECRDQWGDDYLWEKWVLDEAITKIEAALNKVITTEKDKT